MAAPDFERLEEKFFLAEADSRFMLRRVTRSEHPALAVIEIAGKDLDENDRYGNLIIGRGDPRRCKALLFPPLSSPLPFFLLVGFSTEDCSNDIVIHDFDTSNIPQIDRVHHEAHLA